MKTQLNILTVERERKNAYHITTILRDKDNKIKAIFSSMLRQPRKGSKTIVINNSTFLLNWSGV